LSECKVVLVFRRYEEFWRFCFSECREFKLGCAESCRFRKALGILPFGRSYADKFKGEVR
jgi:hypothetical protein